MAKPILALLLAAILLSAATRPRYGGILRVELRDAIEGADPPQSGPGIGDLFGAFTITRWESGRRAVFAADENAAGGRPFLDGVDVQLARPVREQSIDLDLGRAELIQLAPADLRRRKVWSSAPVRLIALVFGPRVEDARLRESLALAVDRAAIHNVLLQRQGEISGGLLPEWLSGYAFLFPTAADLPRARTLAAAVSPAARNLSFAVAEPGLRNIADRIVLNARDAGIALSLVPGPADVRLVEVRIASTDPARALSAAAAALGLGEPPRSEHPESLYNAERALLEGFRAIPLFHLPDAYAVSPRVKGGPGISPLGEWRFENLWLESARP